MGILNEKRCKKWLSENISDDDIECVEDNFSFEIIDKYS